MGATEKYKCVDKISYGQFYGNSLIMRGAELTVPNNTYAVIKSGEIVVDCFPEGRYELIPANLPLLAKLEAFQANGTEPFMADITFVSKEAFTKITEHECPFCNNKLPEASAFCIFCGNKLNQ